MNIQNMSQAEKDQALARFLARERAQELGLSWSKGGFIVVKQGKTDDKSLPALYIHPSFINQLQDLIPSIQDFATNSL